MRLSDWKAEQWLKSSRYLMRTRCIGKVKLRRLWNVPGYPELTCGQLVDVASKDLLTQIFEEMSDGE